MLEDIKTDVAEVFDLIDDVRDGIFEGDPLLAHAGGAIELLRSDDFVAERIDAPSQARRRRVGRRWRRHGGRSARRPMMATASRAATPPTPTPAQKKRRADEPPRDRDAAAG